MTKRINGQIQIQITAQISQKKQKTEIQPEEILETATVTCERVKANRIEAGKTIEYTATIRRQTELVEQNFKTSSEIGINTEVLVNNSESIISIQTLLINYLADCIINDNIIQTEPILHIESSNLPVILLIQGTTFSDTTLVGTAYGMQYTEGIELQDITNFITDYYSLKYLSSRSGINRRDIAKLLTDLSNLLRNCDIYDINEVFLGTLRFQKAKDKNYWVLVEY